jgi:signal transduction histidine kinase
MKNRLPLVVGTSVAATCALLLVVGGVAAWYVHRQEKTTSDLVAQDVQSIRPAESLVLATDDLRLQLSRYLATSDRAILDAVPKQIEAIDVALAAAGELADSDRERDLISEAKRGYQQFVAEFNKARSIDSESAMRSTVRRLDDQLIHDAILKPAQEYLQSKADAVAAVSVRNQQSADRVALGLLLLGVCGSVAGVLAGFGVARGIRRAFVQFQVPVRDASGKLAEVVGPIHVAADGNLDQFDASLRTLADQVADVVDRLQESQQALLRREQMTAVGQLAAGMAHELRNPLTTMKILVQTALEDGPHGRIEGHDLTVLEEEIGRQERSLKALVDFARPPKPRPRRFDAAALLSHAAKLCQSQAERQGIHICVEAPSEPAEIFGDSEQVRQVYMNLLLNALDAMPSGGEVQISASIDTAGVRPLALPFPELLSGDAGQKPAVSPGWLAIRIADTGPGIPAQLGDRIFEPFVSTKETNNGLGLPVCSQIVMVHGGRLSGGNRDEGGAEFVVELPLAPQEKTQTDAAIKPQLAPIVQRT